MNLNSLTTILLCSHISVKENDKPLTQSEYSKLAIKLLDNKLEPKDLLEFSKSDFESLDITNEEYDRYSSLLSRASVIPFEIDKLKNKGIGVITRSDNEYPSLLKQKLKHLSPPLFYYSGNLELLKKPCVGFVGSRSIKEADEEFTKKLVNNLIENDYTIVSGGAKGVDSISSLTATTNGGAAIEFLSDSLLRKIKKSECVTSIRNGKLLLLSAVSPDAGFNVGNAMSRNKYIYAQSDSTIVIKSDYKKGGTWEGALENLKNGWCKELCWNNKDYAGNTALIQHGAIPIDENWNCDINSLETIKIEKGEQLTFELT